MRKFVNPVIEINKFDLENVVTTSSVDGVALTTAALNDAGVANTTTVALGDFDMMSE